MAKIKFIFFDAGKTLIDVHPSVGEIYASTAARYGVHLSQDSLNAGFKRAFPKAPPLCFPGVAAQDLAQAEFEWWKKLVAEVIEPGLFLKGSFAAFFADLYKTFASAQAWKVYDDVRDTLTALQEGGIRLGVISNFDSRLPTLLEDLHLAPFFEKIVFSGAVGAAKPNRDIFINAFPDGLARGEIAMVGNERWLDVEPVKALGAQGFWLVRKPPHPSDPHLKSLKELLNFAL